MVIVLHEITVVRAEIKYKEENKQNVASRNSGRSSEVRKWGVIPKIQSSKTITLKINIFSSIFGNYVSV